MTSAAIRLRAEERWQGTSLATRRLSSTMAMVSWWLRIVARAASMHSSAKVREREPIIGGSARYANVSDDKYDTSSDLSRYV